MNDRDNSKKYPEDNNRMKNLFIREIFENDVISGKTEIKYTTTVIKAVEPNPKRLNTSKFGLKK